MFRSSQCLNLSLSVFLSANLFPSLSLFSSLSVFLSVCLFCALSLWFPCFAYHTVILLSMVDPLILIACLFFPSSRAAYVPLLFHQSRVYSSPSPLCWPSLPVLPSPVRISVSPPHCICIAAHSLALSTCWVAPAHSLSLSVCLSLSLSLCLSLFSPSLLPSFLLFSHFCFVFFIFTLLIHLFHWTCESASQLCC